MSDPSPSNIVNGGGAAGWMRLRGWRAAWASLGASVSSSSHARSDILIDDAAPLQRFVRLRQTIAQTADGIPDHANDIQRHVKAPAPA
ncbi:hypothetical protein [Pelomonas cellulosilytica]|uniref:Uncharacterized protein n=1 Tax=Pelomonas cellulosilytica TaxID=2906762 RepID=A0ABS8XYR0_9BURK|nr:hypothetical protein [Pelomonas sp. P8]MCE4556972.1 hypothetical protein [Pelomonas sp. P8]